MAVDKPDTKRIFDAYINQIEDTEVQEVIYELVQKLEDIFEYYDTMLDFYKTSYVLKWPDATPSVGDSLEVETVNGRNVKLKWV